MINLLFSSNLVFLISGKPQCIYLSELVINLLSLINTLFNPPPPSSVIVDILVGIKARPYALSI